MLGTQEQDHLQDKISIQLNNQRLSLGPTQTFGEYVAQNTKAMQEQESMQLHKMGQLPSLSGQALSPQGKYLSRLEVHFMVY